MDNTINPLRCIQDALKKFNEQIELSIKGESTDLNKFLDSLREHSSARGIDNILLNISTKGLDLYKESTDPIFEFDLSTVDNSLESTFNSMNTNKMRYIQVSFKEGDK